MKMTSFFVAFIMLASSNFDLGPGELHSVVVRKHADRLSRPWIDNIVSSGTINLSIPDANATGLVHTLNLSGIPVGSVVDSIIIGFTVDHTWLEDVVINLEAPNGKILNLVGNRGGASIDGFQNVHVSSDNTQPAFPSGDYGGPLFGTYSADAKTQSALDNDPANGSVFTTPSVNTTIFNDLLSTPNGDWKIHVYDVFPDDVGTLSDWSIKISYHAAGEVPPSVTINQEASQTDPTSASPILFTATFSEAVTGFATGDVTLGGTAGATTAVVSGGPTVYTVSVSGMTNSGTVIASINAGVAIDAGSNPNLASTSTDNTVTYDLPPTVTINQAAGQADPTSASPILFSVTFSEAVTGFATGDVTLSGTAGATTAVVSGSGATYTVTVSGMTTSGTVIASINAGVAIDAGSNPNLASASTDNTVTYDLPPTVTINQAAGQADPTSASPILFTATFSEAVTGFATGDVTLSGTAGATTAVVSGSGATYTVTVSGMTTSGTVIASINAGVAIDAGSNPNLASTSTDNTVTYDLPPTVTINQAAGQADPTSASPILFSVTFSEAVTGFATGDVTLSGTAGATTAVVSGSGATYTVTVSGMTTSGTVIASINAGVAVDAGSNPNLASTSTDNTVTYNVPVDPPPTVTINQGSTQVDPTSNSQIIFDVVFNEPVTGFATGDVTLSGTAGATTAVVSGSGATYTVTVSGMSTSGTVIASINADVALDAGSNPNLASTSTDNTVTYDLPPTVTINQAAGQADPTSASPILFSVTFSEAVTGFATGDVTLSGTAGATTAVVSGSGATYTVTVSGMTTSGTVIASISAGVAVDAGSNPNLASTSTDNTVTYNVPVDPPPTVTINQGSTQVDPTSNSPIIFDVVFNEPVTGFATGDVTLSGTAGATTAVVSGSGATYTVTVSGMTTSGTVIASINAGVAIDAGSNPNLASASTDNTVTYDLPPTVTINQAAGQADPTSASPILFTATFSEAVTGFATGDVTLSGTAGATTAVVSGSGATYTVTVSGMTTSGTVIASINAGVAVDAGSNPNLASTSTDNTVTYDLPPTVTINQAAGQADPTSASPILFSVTFSEAVTGFATGDVTLSGTAGATTAVVSGSGATYTVTVSGMTTSGTVIASISAGVAVDAGSNPNLASTSTDNTVTYNVPVDPPPTVTINQGSTQVDPTSNSPIIFDVVFNEPVTGFATGDVTLSGTAGATTAVVSGSGATYTVTVSGMTTSGTVIASISAGVAVDAGSNPNLASTSTDNTVTYDLPPTVTINQAAGQADPTSASPILFTVTFSEAVTGFATGDVTLSGTAGATTAVVSGSGATYTVTVSGMSTSGTVIASINADVALDAGSNPNLASTSTDNTVTYNVPVDPPPTVTINQGSTQADPTSNSPIIFDVVFNEPVTGFATGDVTLSGTAGATTAVVSGSGATYTVTVSGMTTSGTVIASISAGVAVDAGSNPNLASTSTDNTVTYDLPPTVTINQAAGQADPTSALPILFSVTFSEAVTGFATGDVTLSGTAGATTAVVSGSGATYTVTVSGMTTSGTVIASINAGVAIDAGTNPNLASTSTDNTVAYDLPPTVTINQAAGQADPTSASPILFSVTFSEAVTGFATGDVTLSGTAGATTAVVSGGPTVYTVSVSGMTTSGTVIASISAGVAVDAGTNPNLASTSTDNTVTYNVPVDPPPTVTINQGSTQADPTSNSPIIFDVVFNEPVTGFATGDVTLGGTAGATTAVVSGGPTVYTVLVSGMTTSGTVIASINAGVAIDAGSNPNLVSTSTDNTVTYDLPPTVTINQAAGQADPTSASPILFTATFSEAVTGFATGDVTLSGTAGATTAVVSGSGATYTVTVSGMTTSGTVIASINAGVAIDAGSNPNLASTSTDNTVTYDLPPTVTINQAAGQADPTSASPILFTATFSEAVTGFATGDVTLSGTAGATTAVVSGSGATYTVTVSGMTTSGTVIASISAGVAVDAGSNPNLASTSTDNTVTYDLPPTVTINQAAGQADPTSASPILFTVTFSEAVTGFATGDVTLSGTAGATTAVVSGSGATYTVTVSGMTTSGTVIASINAGVAVDAGSNPNLASTSTDNTVTYNVPVDSPPTVTINQGSTQVDPTSNSPIIFDVVFNEPVTGFATGDVTLSGTAGATTAVVSGSGATYTVTVSGMTTSGTVIASINAGVAIDAGSNPNLVSTSTDNTVTYDLPPTVTINQAAGQADPTSASPILFTATFSEAVTGFATGDVTLSGTAGATTAVVSGSGATYTVTVSGMTTSGTVIASISAGVAVDAGTNPNLASTSTDNTVTYNVPVDPPPTVTINQGSTQVDPTSNSPIIFDVVFNEPVTGFATGDVTLSGTAGATTAVVSGSGATYTVTVSGMSTSGTVIASINADVALDAGSNPNLASTSTDNTVTYNVPVDPPPTVTINQGSTQVDPTSNSPIIFDVVFNEPVTGFATGDVTLSGTAGATTAVVSGSGATYTVTVSGMTTSGTVIASINAGVAIDAGTNPNLVSTSTDNTVAYDLPPTVTINQAAGQADPTSASPILFSVTFSEAVTGFATGDVTLSGTAGATTAVVSGSGATYTVTVSGMSTSGTVIASINADVALDAGSNPNLASTSTDNTVTYNVPVDPPPTVTINQGSTQVDPTSNSPIIFDVVFNEPVTGFATGDVTLSGTAGATTAVVSGSGATYTVTVSGMTTSGTVIASINAGVAVDAGSNPNLASTSTDNTVTYDLPPTVTINQAAGQADPTSASPILFTVTFSEAVTGFATGDVTLSGTAGATTAVVSGSGATYTVTVSGMTTSGTVIASINAGVAIDAGTNPNLVSTSTDNTVAYDLPPTVTINQAAGQADPTSASPILFSVTFSEAVTGFATGDVTLSGTAGATTAVVSGSGATYTVTVSGMSTSGTVIASINADVALDAGSNPNLASTSTDNTVTYNVPVDPPPTVTINQGSTQVDPTSNSPIIFDVVFNEPVTGFATGDVTLSGTAGATTAVVSGSGATYTVTVSGMTTSGTVIASINAGVAVDAGSNPNLASTSTDNTVTYNAQICNSSNTPEVNAVTNKAYCRNSLAPSIVFSSNISGSTFSWSRTNEAIGLGATNGTGNIPSFTTANAGTTPLTSIFTVVASNGSCTGSPTQFTVTVNPLPVVTLTLPFDTLYKNSPVQTLSGGSPAGGSFSGSGIGGTQITPAAFVLGNYQATYTFTNANGCANAAVDQFIIIEKTDNVNVFPNPGNGNIVITAAPDMIGSTVTMFTASGMKVTTWRITGRRQQFNFTKLAAGMYSLVIQQGETSILKQIVIMR